jgi:hypothetical protein
MFGLAGAVVLVLSATYKRRSKQEVSWNAAVAGNAIGCDYEIIER